MTSTERERIGLRAALALRCTDAVTGALVSNHLVADAWPAASPDVVRHSSASPLSGLLGFGLLPGLHPWQVSFSSNGDPLVWPPLATAMDWVVRVSDPQSRYLTVLQTVTPPFAEPLSLPLHSASTRPASPGWALVTGQVSDRASHAPVPWALVQITIGGTEHDALCDGRGLFRLIAPYPEALPPLDPAHNTGLGAVGWPVEIVVLAQPTALTVAPGSRPGEPPVLTSILDQDEAQVDTAGVLSPTATGRLVFGVPARFVLTVQPA